MSFTMSPAPTVSGERAGPVAETTHHWPHLANAKTSTISTIPDHQFDHRHRRPAQRRQVHAVQRADQERRARGELPVRHDRAQRRRRRRARPAAGRAGRAVRLGARSSRRRCRSSTSPASSGARREGQGLGNKFLANIREADAICQVIRVFDDPDVVHVDGEVDPADDIETINTELILADLQTIEKALPRLQKEARTAQGPRAPSLAAAEEAQRGPRQRHGRSSPPALDLEPLRELHLLTAKPFLYVFNVDDGRARQRRELQGRAARARRAGRGDLPRRQDRVRAGRAARRRGARAAAVDRAGGVRASTSSPASASTPSACRPTSPPGPKESRAWTIPSGATAPAGGRRDPHRLPARLHQGRDRVLRRPGRRRLDGRGASRAARCASRARTTSWHDGDVVEFRFNV